MPRFIPVSSPIGQICMPLGLFLDYRLGHGPYSYWQSLDIGLFFSALILLLRLQYIRKKMREEE